MLGTTSESFSYDALGRMLTAVNDDYQVELPCDSVGNLLQDKQGYNVLGSEQWKTVSTTYTDAGSMSSIAYPSTFQVRHTRDAIYRMTAMHDASGPRPTSRPSRGRAPGGSPRPRTRTGRARTTPGTASGASPRSTTRSRAAGASTSSSTPTTRSTTGGWRRTRFNATWMATLPAAVQTFLGGRNGKGDVYAYDMAYRLVDARYDVTNPLTEVQNPGTQPFVTNIAYTIDGLGNRSQVADHAADAADPGDVCYGRGEPVHDASAASTRTHDNNGNLTDDGTYLFGYDFENRLVERAANSTTSALIATYRYDALGRRVEKAVTAAPRRATCSTACRSSRSSTARTSGRPATSTRTGSTSRAAWTGPTSRT